jgi:hypothetical protein
LQSPIATAIADEQVGTSMSQASYCWKYLKYQQNTRKQQLSLFRWAAHAVHISVPTAMFADDECCEMGISFAELEQAEAARLSGALVTTEERLHRPVECTKATHLEPPPAEEVERNYYSEGYDANYDGVDDAELLRWQKMFSFVTVTGSRLGCRTEPPDAFFDENAALHETQNYLKPITDVPPAVDSGLNGLVVLGKTMMIGHMQSSAVLATYSEEEEEIFAIDGTLEEYLELNQEDGIRLNQCETDDSAPVEFVREEVVSSMLDAIWPDLVAAMRPLVHNVLKAAAENNIPYALDQTATSEPAGGGESWAMDGSDDGWG